MEREREVKRHETTRAGLLGHRTAAVPGPLVPSEVEEPSHLFIAGVAQSVCHQRDLSRAWARAERLGTP